MNEKMKTENRRVRTWYERIFARAYVNDARPELSVYLKFDKYPLWVRNVASELFNQNSPTISIKRMHPLTPEKAGKFLGQNCANVYAVAENFHAGMQLTAKLEEVEKQLQAHRANPGVSSAISIARALRLLVKEAPQSGRKFKSLALQAFKKALGQPNHTEAAEFYRGFAGGFSVKGLTPSGAARRTTATPIYLIMFLHWPEVDRLQSVPHLRKYLIQHGLSEQVVGGISRLRRLCSRVGYAPGKRGRPRNSKK